MMCSINLYRNPFFGLLQHDLLGLLLLLLVCYLCEPKTSGANFFTWVDLRLFFHFLPVAGRDSLEMNLPMLSHLLMSFDFFVF